MSENKNKNGNDDGMIVDLAVQHAITELIKKTVESVWDGFVASGFDVKAHVKSAIDGDDNFEHKVSECIDNYDFEQMVWLGIDNYDFDEKVESGLEYIDWGDKIRYNLDIDEITDNVVQQLQSRDMMMEEWCYDNQKVILSREEYDRIMEVINFIRPPR
jgi:hypothetical protein